MKVFYEFAQCRQIIHGILSLRPNLVRGIRHREAHCAEEPAAFAAICEVVSQGQGNRAESDFIPGNTGFGKKHGFERFLAGMKIGIEQPGPIKNVHLTDGRNVDEGEHLPDFNPRVGFFQGFPLGCSGSGFLSFHEAGRQRPLAVLWLDGPPAQQDAVFPLRDGSDDQFGIPIVDHAATCADMTKSGVTGGDCQGDGRTAPGAEIHGSSVLVLQFMVWVIS